MRRKTEVFDIAGKGVQPSNLRLTNQRVLMSLLADNPGSSAADLSRQSQLAPQTVSAVLTDLEEAGLVRTGEVIRGKRGQPATPYFIDPQGGFAYGIEIGWRQVEAVLMDLGGNPIAQYRRDYRFPDPLTIFTELSFIVGQFSDKLPSELHSRVVGVGIAAPNDISRAIAVLQSDPEIIRRWEGVDLRHEAERAVGRPVFLYNDGNAACWAELGAMDQPRPANMVSLLVGPLVGAGIVAQSTLLEGPHGNWANLGSMLITDPHGDQNFVHMLASIHAFEQRLRGAGIEVPPTTPLFWPWDQYEPHVSEWLDEASFALAKTLLNTEAVIEYDVAVVGAVLPPALHDRLLDGVQRHLQSMPVLTFDRPRIVKGRFGASAPSIGAAYLPLFRRFFSRNLSHEQPVAPQVT